MKKVAIVLFLFCSLRLQAQTAGGYTFSVDSTTAYSAIGTDTTILSCPAFAAGDVSAKVTLPRSFTFEGVSYDTIRVGFGGWISFGSNDPLASDASFAYNIFSELANVPGAIAVCAKEDYGPDSTGGVCYTTISTASTADEFTVQWSDINDPEYSVYGIGGINFQLRLEFSTGVIKMCYGGRGGGSGDGQQIKVGLRGNGLDFDTYVNNRQAGYNWKKSVRGNDAGAGLILAALPSGITYIFTPANCLGATNLRKLEETGNSVQLKWNKRADIDGYEFAAGSNLPDSGTFTTDTIVTVTGLPSTTTEYAYVRGKCGTSYTPWEIVQFRTLCDPVVPPYKDTFPYSDVVQIGGAHNYFPCIGVDPDNLTLANGNTQWEGSQLGGVDGMILNNIGSDTPESSWFFTKQVQLNAGTTYRIYFQAERDGFYITQHTPLTVQMANYADTESLIGSPLLSLTFTVALDQTLDTFALFTPSVSGNYCVGFNSSSSTSLGEVVVHEVDVLENAGIPTSCTHNVFPADKDTITYGSDFTFNWNTAPGAQQYIIHAVHSLFPAFPQNFVVNGNSDTTYEIAYYFSADTVTWYVLPRFYGSSATGCETNASVFYIEPANLPLTFVNFTATEKAGNVLLKWQTADEVNTSFFTIQRSSDGKVFVDIGKVNAIGNSQLNNDYSFTDQNPSTGSEYYRIKETDIDGKSTYSNVVSININSVNTSLRIYPNPATDVLNIRLPFIGKADLKIYDLSGRMVSQQEIVANGNVTTLDISKLTHGMYYLRITIISNTQTISFSKE